ncbi:polyketide beta-ketoacyl:ACP synthase [Duganella sp. Leaf126]|uniref:beta-ketoacyl synthase N-terminal-like domain-containing protein n=1 Tax=Duganella sp. Leaf126 TaxID=1736266 RepID=UPI0006F4B20E|nr:beta-ketoacyl synthase N-terminal-like domain-containing protein [Duganella sp. Leaf126]KQQ40267.1 polyketide beta-ketoacyl:ACP synthase [Duganella sp. Leaf126]
MSPDAVVTGLGVVTAIGQGKQAFQQALFAGRHAFDVLRRPGRQLPAGAAHDGADDTQPPFIGAEIADLQLPASLPRKGLRTASLSARAALAVLDEAWREARLDQVRPERIGLIVGGSNVQQRELVLAQAAQAGQPWFIAPAYGHTFLDSDLCGLCTEAFGIRGFAYTLGAASASGQVAVLQAVEAVRSGQADVCIALGALTDLSYWELQALSSMGAMASSGAAESPAAACRPFDRDRAGFVYGEACGAVVVERFDRAAGCGRSGVQPYARCLGGAFNMDGNRHPNPSLGGECSAIRRALRRSALTAAQIDYVNPHASGSPIGDDTELLALRESGLLHACINTTKSLTGHGLAAAGAVEVVATLLQMRAARVHPCRNLDHPVQDGWRFVRESAQACEIRHALTISIGFGGVNSALCWQRL